MEENTPPPGLLEHLAALLNQGRDLVQMFLTPGWRQNQILIVLG